MGTQDSTARARADAGQEFAGQEFAGQVAIVTGGAGTIGEATAQLLIAGGASVVVADVDIDAARRSPHRSVSRRVPANRRERPG